MAETEFHTRLLHAMYAANSADDFCDRLANDVLRNYGTVASYTAMLMPDATISMIGSWGYPLTRRAVDDRPSLWRPMAVTDTIRTGEIKKFESWSYYEAAYPDMSYRAAPGVSFIGIPMLEADTRAGALGLTFDRPLSKVGLSDGAWKCLGAASHVFVARILGFPGVQPDTQGDAHDVSRPMLTTREIDVLRKSAAGMTVREIARELKLSESSIKQTRMAIYRKLKIDSRSDLQYAAHALLANQIDNE